MHLTRFFLNNIVNVKANKKVSRTEIFAKKVCKCIKKLPNGTFCKKRWGRSTRIDMVGERGYASPPLFSLTQF